MAGKLKQIYERVFALYEQTLSYLLRIDLLQVRKDKFVRKVIQYTRGKDVSLCEVALQTSLQEVLTPEECHKYYLRMMRKYAFTVFVISFLTSFPEETVSMIVACVLDFVLFQAVLYRAMQSILLLHGKDCDLNEDEDKGIATIISIESSGLMIGKYPVLQKLKIVAGWLGKQIVKRIGPRVTARLSSSLFKVIRQQGIKWVLLVTAKNNVSIMLDALIPITCAAISGLVSVVILVPMCNKLRKHLIANEQFGE